MNLFNHSSVVRWQHDCIYIFCIFLQKYVCRLLRIGYFFLQQQTNLLDDVPKTFDCVSYKLNGCVFRVCCFFFQKYMVITIIHFALIIIDGMENIKNNQDKFYDVIAGLVTGFCVSPTNAILDRSVIQYANGKETIQNGMRNGLRKLIFSPLQFILSFKFRWMYFTYAVTYTANNLSDHDPITPRLSLPLQNLLITFSVNTICGILKDKAYIQYFGAVASKPFPLIALGLLFFRDLITMASAFTLPHIMAQQLKQKFKMSERKGFALSQMFSPLAVQVLVTPIHLLGLDLYNREGIKIGQRYKYIKGLYPSALALRMIRFLPAYGIGGVINNELRRALKH